MEGILTENTFKDKLVALFEENKRFRWKSEPDFMHNLREEALQSFVKLGFPNPKMEAWRQTNLAKPLALEYIQHLEPSEEKVDLEKIFHCDVYNLDTYLFSQLNGWFISDNQPLTTISGGVVVGSMAKAMKVYPQIFEKHFAHYADIKNNGFDALNTAFAQDGIFIYVPDNVIVDKPIQIINIINLKENIFIQPRHLLVMGKNSSLQLVYCDHSLLHKASLISSVGEIYVGENAHFDHYKLQNKDSESTLLASIYFHLEANSTLNSNIITLNGGIVRNNSNVTFAGEGAEANLYGLYLADKDQHVDNHIFVDHAVPNCVSNQLFKGILDDQAQGVFNGKVLVRQDAQKTNAFQTNRNILLTDKANVHSEPHLEIYADDVKCSHGATVGQLNPEAMFYLRSRGISEDSARMLLMNAFAEEVIDKIAIEPLRERMDELIIKRLKGELSICDQCILDCSGRKPVKFDIDLSKI
ncbi:MAG: Fe-S cluster assembly protein SufD [Lentimicrobiaceae bacterium]|nr:Fe-S cluster assembly protein SufD [Lentimicrobiaceae bacterium]